MKIIITKKNWDNIIETIEIESDMKIEITNGSDDSFLAFNYWEREGGYTHIHAKDIHKDEILDIRFEEL